MSVGVGVGSAVGASVGVRVALHAWSRLVMYCLIYWGPSISLHDFIHLLTIATHLELHWTKALLDPLSLSAASSSEQTVKSSSASLKKVHDGVGAGVDSGFVGTVVVGG